MTNSLKQNMISVLNSLIAGTTSREAASKWATEIIDDDSVSGLSKEIWDVLVNIGAADLVSSDRAYLYETDDFKDWLSILLRL